MDDKQIDKLFREKLNSHSTPVDGSDLLWDSIASSLDKREGGHHSMKRIIIYSISSVAAIAIAAYFLFAPNSQEPYIKEINETSALAQEVEQTPNETQPKFQPIETKQDHVAALTQTRTSTKQTSLKQARESVQTPLYVAEVGDITTERDSLVQKEEVQTTNQEAVAHPQKQQTQVTQISRAGKSANEYAGYTDWGEDIPAQKDGPGISMALASNIVSGSGVDAPNNIRTSMMSGSNFVKPAGMPVIERVSDVKYSLPFNIGLQVQFKINSFLSIGAGVNYTMLRSKYDGLIDKKMHSVKQTLHYIGVPVNLYGMLLQKKDFSLYANLGASIEKGLRAVYSIKSYDQTDEYSSAIEGVQYSVNFGVGIEYRFIPLLGIYLEPNAIYFFNSKVPNSLRTDQPFQLKAEIGFRFHF
ncbi:MAG: outer membrane beta-barrel protein [Bacteroidales bacterium]